MRMLPAYSPKCCVEPLAVAMQHICLLPELQREYCKLFRRQQEVLTRNKRILSLAQPKWRNDKFLSPCFCPEVVMQKVKIVREEMPHTRTEQLAYPPVGRLLELRDRDSFQQFSYERRSTINRTLRKSMLSLYSRLSKIKPPAKKEKPTKLSELEYELHLKRWKELAKPKGSKDEPKKKEEPHKKKSKAPKQHPPPPLRRYKTLSKPKLHETFEAQEWHLSNAIKTFKPSPRLLQMAQPKMYEPFDPDRAFRVQEQALHYRASDRIKKLAVPSIFYQKPETKEAPYTTSPKALKAKASQRVLELAEPKSYSDSHTRAFPFRVPRSALRAKLTPRLNQLARPKDRGGN